MHHDKKDKPLKHITIRPEDVLCKLKVFEKKVETFVEYLDEQLLKSY